MRKTYLLIDGSYKPTNRVKTFLKKLGCNSETIQLHLVIPFGHDSDSTLSEWKSTFNNYPAYSVEIDRLASFARSMDLFMAVAAGKQRRDDPDVNIVILSPNTRLLPLRSLVNASVVFAKHWFDMSASTEVISA